jgi:hypothetical protein
MPPREAPAAIRRRLNGASWSTVTVDAAGNTGYVTSLAFGPDGQPAISYWDSGNCDLRFARFDGNKWSAVTVDAAPEYVAGYTSLAFGPDGQPSISYHVPDPNKSDLHFARFNAGSWNVVTVDALGATGLHPSLAFMPDGQPAIAYYDATNGDLRFAQRYVPTP